jgi:hypothetical protein
MGKQQNRNLEARPAKRVHRLAGYMDQDFAVGNTQVRDWNIDFCIGTSSSRWLRQRRVGSAASNSRHTATQRNPRCVAL